MCVNLRNNLLCLRIPYPYLVVDAGRDEVLVLNKFDLINYGIFVHQYLLYRVVCRVVNKDEAVRQREYNSFLVREKLHTQHRTFRHLNDGVYSRVLPQGMVEITEVTYVFTG